MPRKPKSEIPSGVSVSVQQIGKDISMDEIAAIFERAAASGGQVGMSRNLRQGIAKSGKLNK